MSERAAAPEQATPTTAQTDETIGNPTTGPKLAHVNPQPRLPGSEAAVQGETLERFAKRLRRVRLGSHRLKMAALALAVYGQAWSKTLTAIRISIKRQTLADEWECRLATVDDCLRGLEALGMLQRKRGRGCIHLTLFSDVQSDRNPITLGGPECAESDLPGFCVCRYMPCCDIAARSRPPQRPAAGPGPTHDDADLDPIDRRTTTRRRDGGGDEGRPRYREEPRRARRNVEFRPCPVRPL